MGSSSVGDEGANLLAQALRVNTSLSSLDLSSNLIGDKVANSLPWSLRVNTSLFSLNVGSSYIGVHSHQSEHSNSKYSRNHPRGKKCPPATARLETLNRTRLEFVTF